MPECDAIDEQDCKRYWIDERLLDAAPRTALEGLLELATELCAAPRGLIT